MPVRVAVDVGPDLEQHRDLLQRAVAGPLAEAVDRALDLARAGDHPGVGVGDGQPQVVVAVDRGLDLAQVRDQLVEARPHRRVLLGRRVADRVGDVDHRRPGVDRDLQHLGGELEVGAGRVHRRELDVLAVGTGHRHRRLRLPLDVLAVGLQLVLDMDVGGRDEGVDARPRGVLDRPPGGVDVGLVGAGQAADDRPFDRAGDRLDRLEVTRRGDRETGLDHVDPEPRQLLGDLHLLGGVQRDARRLLAVAQRRVEDVDALASGDAVTSVSFGPMGPLLLSESEMAYVSRGYRAAQRYSPRGGRRRRSARLFSGKAISTSGG